MVFGGVVAVVVIVGGFAHHGADAAGGFFNGEVAIGFGVLGEAGFFGFGDLDAAGAEFDGLEARVALADGAEFGVVHVGTAGLFEEAKLELFFGEF